VAQLCRLHGVVSDYRDHLDQPPRHAPALVSVDHAILVLNLLLLLTIVLLPFSTALMAAYLKASNGQNAAAVIYGASFFALSLAFFTIHRHMLLAKQHLLQEHLTPPARRQILRRNAVGLVPYAIATVGGILTPYITLVICAAVAGFYALPSTSAERQPLDRDEVGDDLDRA